MNCPICSNELTADVMDSFLEIQECIACRYSVCAGWFETGNEVIKFNSFTYLRCAESNRGAIKNTEGDTIKVIPMIPINKDTEKRLTNLLAFL